MEIDQNVTVGPAGPGVTVGRVTPPTGGRITPPTAGRVTPLMQQYWDVKAAHPDKIILFRMGDFFEMFHRDAELAAPVLGIALTSRNKKSQDETPMCGVPHHSATTIINKLLAAGFKVAICDQLEDPKFAKGLVKRGITRVLSPGMVYDHETLDASNGNYLASWDGDDSLAFFDVSTGEGFYFRSVTVDRRKEFLASLRAVEWVLSSPSVESDLAEEKSFSKLKVEAERLGAALTIHDGLDWIAADGEEISVPARVTVGGVGPSVTVGGVGPSVTVGGVGSAPECVRRLISYSISQFSNSNTQAPKAATIWAETLRPFEERRLEGRMVLSTSTLRHLEVFETNRGERKGSVLSAIDRTKTSGGARLLRSWLQFPLNEAHAIEARLDRVGTWASKDQERKSLRQALAGVGDLPRRLGKISQPSRGPRDILSLAQSLSSGLEAWRAAVRTDQKLAQGFSEKDAEDIAAVIRRIDRTIVDEPPVFVRTGGTIKKGVSSALDELIELSTGASRLVLDLEQREKELTGISSLKVKYNNVFGYSIEITNTHKDRVPLGRYERKQTLANAERFTTKELSELELKVVSAHEKRLKLEEEEFVRLLEFVLANSKSLTRFALSLAELDTVSALGHLANEENYVRPKLLASSAPVAIRLRGSRHPVVEQSLSKPFVENDIELSNGGCLLLTGPNMAGKSTLMRQVAISVILTQIGCFVPAKEAELSLLDRVATRIGASDFLSEGLSTFMVEMKETAELLADANDRTLVVLDEIGRGTSTFDGLSIAQAILEHLLTEKRCLTMFATHYHELTKLSIMFDRIRNCHMAIHEKEGVITFLHRLREGEAGQSYGLHVARLAGIPLSVTSRAQEILSEVQGSLSVGSPRSSKAPQLIQLPLIVASTPANDEILREIRKFDVNHSTPMDALGKILEWTKKIDA